MTFWKSVKKYLSGLRKRDLAPANANEFKERTKDLNSNFEEAFQPDMGEPITQTKASDVPIWKLVLIVAQRLQTEIGDFRMIDLVTEVQRIDPSRGRGSIQPVVQGMTSNAGMGPYSPCGEPLFRVSHGVYRLVGDNEDIKLSSETKSPATSPPNIPHTRRAGNQEVVKRVEGVIEEFSN